MVVLLRLMLCDLVVNVRLSWGVVNFWQNASTRRRHRLVLNMVVGWSLKL